MERHVILDEASGLLNFDNLPSQVSHSVACIMTWGSWEWDIETTSKVAVCKTVLRGLQANMLAGLSHFPFTRTEAN